MLFFLFFVIDDIIVIVFFNFSNFLKLFLNFLLFNVIFSNLFLIYLYIIFQLIEFFSLNCPLIEDQFIQTLEPFLWKFFEKNNEEFLQTWTFSRMLCPLYFRTLWNRFKLLHEQFSKCISSSKRNRFKKVFRRWEIGHRTKIWFFAAIVSLLLIQAFSRARSDLITWKQGVFFLRPELNAPCAYLLSLIPFNFVSNSTFYTLLFSYPKIRKNRSKKFFGWAETSIIEETLMKREKAPMFENIVLWQTW